MLCSILSITATFGIQTYNPQRQQNKISENFQIANFPKCHYRANEQLQEYGCFRFPGFSFERPKHVSIIPTKSCDT